MSNCPKTKNGPHLGLRGSNPKSKRTYSAHKLPVLVVSEPQHCPTRRLYPGISGHLVELEKSPGRTRWGHCMEAIGSLHAIYSSILPKIDAFQ